MYVTFTLSNLIPFIPSYLFYFIMTVNEITIRIRKCISKIPIVYIFYMLHYVPNLAPTSRKIKMFPKILTIDHYIQAMSVEDYKKILYDVGKRQWVSEVRPFYNVTIASGHTPVHKLVWFLLPTLRQLLNTSTLSNRLPFMLAFQRLWIYLHAYEKEERIKSDKSKCIYFKREINDYR